ADHRPDPDPADRRLRVRRRDAVGRPPGRLLQGDARPPDLPDEPAAPPLRARRLGRGEDHPPLLDRWDHRRAGWRDALPRLHQPAAVSTMTADRQSATDPVDLAALTPAALIEGVLRGRPVSVLGFARSGIALARFLTDAGAVVTVYDA